MNSIRVKFSRGDEVKYISHLDLLKVFERAFRRGNLPIAYNQGFNPRPQIVFGLPLSVGVTSESEYADFDFSENISFEELKEKLNKELPEGIQIIEGNYKKTKENIMATLDAASYALTLSGDRELETDDLNQKLSELLSKNEIMIDKSTKKGLKKIDIRPMIFELNLISERAEVLVKEINNTNEDTKITKKVFHLSALLSAGSRANLKPEMLIMTLNDMFDLKIEIVKIHRTGLFIKREGEFLSPIDENILLAT